MSVLTGPEIRRLATPCTVGDLRHHDCVWRNGERLRLLAADRRPDYYTVACFENADGRQVWERIDSDDQLIRCGSNGERIVVDPFVPAMVGPASLDLTLGDTLAWYDAADGDAIDPRSPPPTFESVSACGWRLAPGRVYLAATRERTETHRLSAQVAGRSSWGRYGLFVHVTAGYVDPGFCGPITLELVATQPILVRPGDKIAQLVYTTLVGEYREYAGRYQTAPAGPVASRFHLPDGGTT